MMDQREIVPIEEATKNITNFATKDFPIKLPYDMAYVEETEGDTLYVLSKYGLTLEDYLKIKKNPFFIKQFTEARELVKESTSSEFKKTAQTMANEYLSDVHKIIRDDATKSMDKLKAISEVVRWAGYDQNSHKTSVVGDGGRVSITLNLGGDVKEMKKVEGTIISE